MHTGTLCARSHNTSKGNPFWVQHYVTKRYPTERGKSKLAGTGWDRSLTPFIMLPAAQKILLFIRPFFSFFLSLFPQSLNLSLVRSCIPWPTSRKKKKKRKGGCALSSSVTTRFLEIVNRSSTCPNSSRNFLSYGFRWIYSGTSYDTMNLDSFEAM